MQKEPDRLFVAMVVLNYNDCSTTIQYINLIKSFNSVDYIVVVDNCSTDDSFTRISEIAEGNIKLIRTESNKGYAAGNNFGVNYVIENHGTNGIVIISNPDIYVENESIVKICKAFSDNGNLFAITGEVCNSQGETIREYIWKLPTYGMSFCFSSVILRNLCWKFWGYGKYYNYKDISRYKIIKGDSIPGCFFAADINKWQKIGGFNEGTFLYFEEDHLFWAAKEEKYDVCMLPNCKIIHYGGASINKSIKSWFHKEQIRKASKVHYMKACLGCNTIMIYLYSVWNFVTLPGRYISFSVAKGKKQ